ncbi:MAG: sigma-24, subfamily [Acidobacteriales bacterium]|nr:sigma-24, subfamily [Terriglobales bacterium]
MSDLLSDDCNPYALTAGIKKPVECVSSLFETKSSDPQRCEVIRTQLESLYVLAYMLTASRELAERTLVSAVDHILCDDSFDTDLCSWNIRIVALNAVSALRVETDDDELDTWSAEDSNPELADLINAVTGLAAMERCVFVLSVLERFADMECAILLDSNVEEIVETRISALQHLTSDLIGAVDSFASMDA